MQKIWFAEFSILQIADFSIALFAHSKTPGLFQIFIENDPDIILYSYLLSAFKYCNSLSSFKYDNVSGSPETRNIIIFNLLSAFKYDNVSGIVARGRISPDL